MFDRNSLIILEKIITKAAEEELMTRFRLVEVTKKQDGTLVTEADLQMQARVITELEAAWPEYDLLGEEMDETTQQTLLQNNESAIWCLDPLDGTSNYASGVPFFGVSLALISAQEVLLGIVYDPVRKEMFSAIKGQGAWLNGEKLQLETGSKLLSDAMAMVDLKRLPVELITKFAKQAPYHSQRSFGSVALDWCWMAADRMQVYLHGGQKLWDYAAGNLIFAEAGGVGGIYQNYQWESSQQLSLQPRIGMAASSEDLYQQWSGWITAGVEFESPKS